MAKADRCPRCHSANIKRTMVGYAEEGVGAAVRFGIEFYLYTKGVTANTDGVHDSVPTQYYCKSCGNKWHVTSINGDSKPLGK